MDYEMLYRLIDQNRNRKLSDIPDEFEGAISGLKGEDLLTGMLGMYMRKKLPEGLSVASDEISYSPNSDSTYGLSIKNNTPTISGSWRF
ncbi:hypothetical protein N8529_00135 [bacterium]|nr:hypothetical protein [bacterium]